MKTFLDISDDDMERIILRSLADEYFFLQRAVDMEIKEAKETEKLAKAFKRVLDYYSIGGVFKGGQQ